MEHYIHFVLLTETHHQVARDPDIIRGFGRAFGEDLELPLAFCDFSVDALMIDTGGETQFQVLLDELARQAAHIFVANAAVVRSLRSGGMSVLGEAERTPVLVE